MNIVILETLTILSFPLLSNGNPCPSNKWTLREEDQTCYIFINQAKVWDMAVKFCRSRNSSLVSIPDMTTNKFIFNFIGGNNTSWIGLYSFDDFRSKDPIDADAVKSCTEKTPNTTEEDMFIQVNDRKYGLRPGQKLSILRDWTWIDRSPFSFDVWSHVVAKNAKFQSPTCTDKCCGVVMDSNGMWEDVPLSFQYTYDTGSNKKHFFRAAHPFVCALQVNGTVKLRTSNFSQVDQQRVNQQLMNWDKDLDWMERVNYDSINHLTQRIQDFTDTVNKLKVDTLDVYVMMIVLLFMSVIILLILTCKVSLGIRKTRKQTRQTLRGFHSYRGHDAPFSLQGFEGPEGVRFKTLNNNQEQDLLNLDH